MSKPLTRWRKTRKKETPSVVGKFFELVAAKVAKAQFSKLRDQDLVMPKIGVGIEVKANNNSNAFRIRTDQFEDHMQNVGEFPALFDRFLYFFFCYCHQEQYRGKGIPRRSLIAKCKDSLDVFRVLAQKTDTLFIFDHLILEKIRKRQGVSIGKFPDKDQDVFELPRRLLRSFNEFNANMVLSSLGLEPEEWVIRERCVRIDFTIGIFENRLDLTVVEVLPQEFVESFSRASRVPASPLVPSRRSVVIESAPLTIPSKSLVRIAV